ncbi:MAG: hypothetical protein V4739_17990 [Pseudomonadota bacterium]
MTVEVGSERICQCLGDPGPAPGVSSSSGDMAQVAARYLSLALSDGHLSADEKAVSDALNGVPGGTMNATERAAFERFLGHAQRSDGGLSLKERQIVEILLDTFKAQARGDVVDTTDATRATTDRQATALRQGNWFSCAAIFELARLDANSVEWAQIERTLGHEVSHQNRMAAINAAKNLVASLVALYTLADNILQDMRKGVGDSVEFQTDSVAEFSDELSISKLGNESAMPSGHSLGVVDDIEFERFYTDVFGGAEKIACPSSNPHHGWFILTDALQLAGEKKVRHGRKPTTTSALTQAMKEASPSSLPPPS